ncbi:MAG: hypothetical protein HQ501_08115 [Rhodospirillales bacterium]|nr:hypothetical protein [Rhodospirillales bacterium]
MSRLSASLLTAGNPGVTTLTMRTNLKPTGLKRMRIAVMKMTRKRAVTRSRSFPVTHGFQESPSYVCSALT